MMTQPKLYVSFFLRNQRLVDDKPTLTCRITVGPRPYKRRNERACIATQIHVESSQWDAARRQVSEDVPKAAEHNAAINRLLQMIQLAYHDLLSSDSLVSAPRVRGKYLELTQLSA